MSDWTSNFTVEEQQKKIAGNKSPTTYGDWERPSDLIKSPKKKEEEDDLNTIQHIEETPRRDKVQQLFVLNNSKMPTKSKKKAPPPPALDPSKTFVAHSDFWGVSEKEAAVSKWSSSSSEEETVEKIEKSEEKRSERLPVFTRIHINYVSSAIPETEVQSTSTSDIHQKSYEDYWNSPSVEIEEEVDQKTLDAKKFLENANNVFTPFYQSTSNDKKKKKKKTIPRSAIGKELRSYKHTDAIEFAATSWFWATNSERNLEKLPRHKTLGVPAFPSEDATRAYYRVMADKYDKYILIACHVNSHAYHRGDLRFIEVNDRTVLKGFERKSVMGNLFLGDVVAVTKLALKSGGPAIGNHVASVSHESKCTWMAHKMTLLTRNKPAQVIFSFLSNGAAVVKGFDEAMSVVDANPLDLQTDVLYAGQAFIPERCGAHFCDDFNTMHKNQLVLNALKIATYPSASGTIYTFSPSDADNEMFRIGTKAFSAEVDAPSVSFREKVVETCVLMGYSAANTIFNGRFDCRVFPVLNATRDKQFVRFSIDNPEDQPTEGRWNTNNRIMFGGPLGDIPATIETAVSNMDRLNLVARLPKGTIKNADFSQEGYVVFQREPLDPNSLRDGFFTNLNARSNGKRIITTLYGGDPIPLNNPIVPCQFVFPGQPPTMLNQYQNEYVFMMLDRNPIVLGSSPFGCGKSVTIVTAALEIHKRNCRESVLRKQNQQLLITQSNYASVNLIDIVQKAHILDDDRDGVKFVRYVSEKNWREMPDNCRTQYDMPSLMERVFVQWAVGMFEGDRRARLLNFQHMSNMLFYIFDKNLLDPVQTAGAARNTLDGMTDLKKKPFNREITEAFFILYQPDIIMTTADSSQSLLNAQVLTDVTTVQIDEASQVPEYTFLNLLASFPDACFGLIGDVHQLPPYCEEELNGRLREYGIGNTMERALQQNMFPKSVLRYVYRCHPVTTSILSDLFYDGDLISGVEQEQRNEFITRRCDIWPNDRFPICVLDNKDIGKKTGTSLTNKAEINLVVRLISSLTRAYNGYQLRAADIGVISFYAAQTSKLTEALRGSGVKCGTVDAFQGSEREVVVLCCTNERLSEFMQLSNRLNVALSRARQATIIIGNVNGLRKARFWSTILRRVEHNGCVVDPLESGQISGVSGLEQGFQNMGF